ncbi:CGNR zinc finger domain-containing protein [Massilia sp. GCM10020059]|uniref:CGNR zinc finger domain-containing protein n=1 Tax=Massilia agrisoli TaxID=2892444 RepID=A0ABS8ITK7_9BURK|nr:ABATE domain-containing protein [Massilia agrisoli]MCC6071781.1 CGNR zinc finger domain-containing protein [Massilia agrisoli]
MTVQQTGVDAGPFVMVGDHPAMDLLNTQAGCGANEIDFWKTGADVLEWCRRKGIAPPADASLEDQAGLLRDAKAVRAIARELIEQRKQGQAIDPAPLNRYLHASRSAPHVGVDADGTVVLTRTPDADAATQITGALAESVAQLLAEGDFSLVKQCEHPDCVLWFYDRTKAHRRRWCSMTLCGNRVKAAQFRKRAAASAA